MYTPTITGKTIDKPNRKIVLDVTFSNGTDDFSNRFTFPLYTTVDQIKRVIKEYIEEIDSGESLESSVTTGEVDLSNVSTTAPQEQQDFQAWSRKVTKLERVMSLVDLGVFTGSETPIQNLQNDVKTSFKPEYLNYM